MYFTEADIKGIKDNIKRDSVLLPRFSELFEESSEFFGTTKFCFKDLFLDKKYSFNTKSIAMTKLRKLEETCGKNYYYHNILDIKTETKDIEMNSEWSTSAPGYFVPKYTV